VKIRFIVTLTAILMIAVCCSRDMSSDWKIADNPILTEWAKDINPNQPWPEYPRPMMERDDWKNLNGLWDYAITESGSEPVNWEGKILVPYPVESALSGIKRRLSEKETLWYRRDFKVPAGWKNQRILLNFEASDWETTVLIDGSVVGAHLGGYDPFSFDITGYLTPGKDHELLVSVLDPTDKGNNPRGKQVTEPRGIWYTPVTGIWQTVWLEPVSATHFDSFKILTDVESGDISLSPIIVNLKDGMTINLKILREGNVVAEESKPYDETLKVKIKDVDLWTPGNPALYEIELSIAENEIILDQVRSYTGFRKISVGKSEDGFTRILLNNEFVYQNGPLDQGFWPDGIYTPPTEEAMVYDLEMIKKMGFNMLRKHVKIENRRFYYWCDKLGLLVWQDMPSGDRHTGRSSDDIDKAPEDRKQFEAELSRMIETKYNHPSIIIWVPFNEGWGQYETAEVTNFIKDMDPTRLVNSASGWADRGTGDIHDVHHYPEPICPSPEEERAIVLGEFGGLGLAVQDHTWEQKNWGYQNMINTEDLLEKYEMFYSIVHDMVTSEGLSATVYTQITDVETETNGLLTYDRRIDKMGYENVAKANLGLLPPSLESNSRIFIDNFKIELKTSGSDAEIYYTLDGSDPDIKSLKYSGPFNIEETVDLKVIAIWYDGSSRIRSYRIEKTVHD